MHVSAWRCSVEQRVDMHIAFVGGHLLLDWIQCVMACNKGLLVSAGIYRLQP